MDPLTDQQQMLDRMLSGDIVLSTDDRWKLVLANLRDQRDTMARVLVLLEGNGKPGLIKRVSELETAGHGMRWIRLQLDKAMPFILSTVIIGLLTALWAFGAGHLTWHP